MRPAPEQWKPNGRPEHLRRACEGSLRRLRLERIGSTSRVGGGGEDLSQSSLQRHRNLPDRSTLRIDVTFIVGDRKGGVAC